MFDVASSINQLNLNDTEIGLLAAVILATPGKVNSYIGNPSKVVLATSSKVFIILATPGKVYSYIGYLR